MNFIAHIFAGCNVKLIRHSFCLISLLISTYLEVFTASYIEYKDFICDAIKNTYHEGEFRYNLTYRSLDSHGDTSVIRCAVVAVNTTRGMDFTAICNDSLMYTFLDEELLYANMSNSIYRKIGVKYKNIDEYVDFIYPPLLQRRFEKAIFNGKYAIERESESNEFVVFKIGYMNTGDIKKLFFTIVISKINNTVVKYSYTASVGNIGLWEEYDLSSFEQVGLAEASSIIRSEYDNIVGGFSPIDDRARQRSPDSILTDFEVLKQELPYYDLVSIHGDTTSMGEVESKYFLVDFWFRLCYPCIQSIPILKDLKSKYGSDISIISINPVDKNLDLVKEFMEKNDMLYDVYVTSLQCGKDFKGVNSYPTFILYNSKFDVVLTIHGYKDDLEKRIERAMTH